MAKYRILHTQAGQCFCKGQEVTGEQIVAAGYDPKHWLSHQAIESVDAPLAKPDVQSVNHPNPEVLQPAPAVGSVAAKK